MTTRNLDALFSPKAIALVGASNQPGSVGAVLARNLFNTGFSGPIMPVNPHEQAIRSTVNYKSIADLPVVPDLAVIATPPKTVPGIVAELGQRGCRAAVVITAGFGEGDRKEGEDLRQQMLLAAQPHLMRIVGPNCLGFISPAKGINASFAHLTPPPGDLAFVTQSGAIALAVLDWASAHGAGFSHVVSLGDMADVDFGDLLDYLALDRSTRAILLYAETVTEAQKFMAAGRIAARAKPVLVIKSGRSAAGAKAALSHTGALAGADLVYDAAFRRAGMLRVYELRELFEAVATLAAGFRPAGDRLAVLTNGGGAGVLAVDALDDRGGRLAALSKETLAKLDLALPHTWSHANPVDILGDAKGDRYAAALAALFDDPDRDAILVLNCPTAVADSLDAAKAVVAALTPNRRVPVLTCWLGETAVAESRKLLSASHVPTYETPDEAVRAFMHLVRYRRNQELLLETPRRIGDSAPPDRETARQVARQALAEGRKVLTEPEAKAVLSAYGIPTVATRIARDPDEAGRLAAEIGTPVALKILSPDISHKSDVGGVRLNLDTPAAVVEAARAMLGHVGAAMPKARITGFVVEAMAVRPHAHELLAGIGEDATFGPVILFGQGGTATEAIGDRAIGLPPLNAVLAREMIDRTRIAKLLKGFRDWPAVDFDAIAFVLVRLAELAADIDEIGELDINPLLADAQGVLALDARIVVREAAPAVERFAITPYPAELEHRATLTDGFEVLVRPIRPEDEPALVDLVARSSPEDVRLRFLGPLKELPHLMAARFSQIDYSREMAFVAMGLPGRGDEREMYGGVRFVADPNIEDAEYAVMVRSDFKGRGLGWLLMTNLLAYAKARGLKRLHGDVLRENTGMLQMAKELGFTRSEGIAPEAVRVTVEL